MDLADDALAALHSLRAQPKVDPARVGLVGFSQGGHIIPVAAMRSMAVAFAVNISGSVVPIMEQIGDELQSMGVREGLSEDALKTVQAIHSHAMHYVLTGQDWINYESALAAVRHGQLGDSAVLEGFPTEPDSPAWDFLRTIGDFDPLPYWQEVEVPALFIYGGRDENVAVYKSADIIEESLTPTCLPYTLILFRNNGHALFREDAMDFIARWIRDGGAD